MSDRGQLLFEFLQYCTAIGLESSDPPHPTPPSLQVEITADSG